MRYARIIDAQGRFLTNDNDLVIRVDSTRFKDGVEAKKYLKQLESSTGKAGLQYCCSYGACKCAVHFRSESKIVSGKKSEARGATWVSNNIQNHLTNCPGPSERGFAHLPHNGLSLSNAIATSGEQILFHLNIDLETKSKEPFNKSAVAQTDDVKWRKANAENHSYYAVSSLSQLSTSITQIIREGGKEALLRTRIAHEGLIPRLQQFIVRNNVVDRMRIIEGENGNGGLRFKANLMERHSIRNSRDNQYVFGAPRLLMFEAAQTYDLSMHLKPQRVKGWRYEVMDKSERRVYDQLNLQKTGLMVDDFYPNGAIVLARPFIEIGQDPQTPVLHWSIQSEHNIDLNPSPEMIKLLCWHGQNVPQTPRPPKQLRLAL